VKKIQILVGGDDDSEQSSLADGLIPPSNANVDSTPVVIEPAKEICSYDTIDALPHVDHYRNLFSITSPESKIRPTLEALHETSRLRLGSTIDLNSEMLSTVVPPVDQPSIPENKPKIEIVKFGWIVGVLVC